MPSVGNPDKSPIRRVEYISIDAIKPAKDNPKRHADEAIRQSMDRWGYTEPLLLDERTGHLVAGHGRLQSLLDKRESGDSPPEGVTADWQVPVTRGWASKNDDEANGYLVADNRLTELGGWDNTELLALLDSLDDLEGVGYTLDEIQELSAKVTELPPTPQTDPDAVPPAPKEPKTKRGDIWLLGNHRILCGDSRDYNDVEKLMDGEKVNVAFTSPPYASQRKYDESSGFKPIHPDEYVEWFEDVQANVRTVLADDGSWFVNIKEHTEGGHRSLYVKDLAIAHAREWGWRFVDELCWDRGGLPGRFPDKFKNAWEPVFHFATASAIKFDPLAVAFASDGAFSYDGEVGNLRLGAHGVNRAPSRPTITRDIEKTPEGMALPSNVVKVSQGGDGSHSAAFPVALPQWFIKAYSDTGDNIYDPFMGSGSTLIAAHNENRNAYGVEISPAYCDVIARRFQEHTGIKPVLKSTGEPVDFADGDSPKGVTLA